MARRDSSARRKTPSVETAGRLSGIDCDPHLRERATVKGYVAAVGDQGKHLFGAGLGAGGAQQVFVRVDPHRPAWSAPPRRSRRRSGAGRWAGRGLAQLRMPSARGDHRDGRDKDESKTGRDGDQAASSDTGRRGCAARRAEPVTGVRCIEWLLSCERSKVIVDQRPLAYHATSDSVSALRHPFSGLTPDHRWLPSAMTFVTQQGSARSAVAIPFRQRAVRLSARCRRAGT